MTDQRPDPGDPTAFSDPVDPTGASPGQAEAEVNATDLSAASATADSGDLVTGPDAEPSEADSADQAADAGLGAAAVSAAAWTTTPVAPDPEATEAALAALAARPEVTLEPPEGPPPQPLGMDEEPPDEGTPVLLVGGILVGAFIVALAIVILLFRPFDSGSPDATLSPSPVMTEAPSASPSAQAVIDTPNFQGLSLEEAELTAEDYGLVVRVISVVNDEAAPGTVLGQQPPPGEAVPVGSTIELSVAVASPTVAVPDILDLPEAEAMKALADAGLSAGLRSTAADPTIVAGNIVSSNPVAATEVAPGSAISYVVSSGPALVAVPDILDLPEAEAMKALADAGLSAGLRSTAADPTIVAGNVVSSNPVAATEVAPGSAISYVVSSGPALVAVPDILDLPEAEAMKALADAGLSAGLRSTAADPTIVAGNIVSSNPVAATEVAPGSAISYVVSSGPALVAVPSFEGQSLTDATTAATSVGLFLRATSIETTEAEPETILDQDPSTGTMVVRGSTVDVDVAVAPETTAVPDLAGSADEAAQALADARLVGAPSEAFSADVAAGDVMSQDPAAGTSVPVGSRSPTSSRWASRPPPCPTWPAPPTRPRRPSPTPAWWVPPPRPSAPTWPPVTS